MVSDEKKQFHILPLDQPIVSLDCKDAFNCLLEKEKLYAHYLSRASWVGGLITFLQTSPESGPLFVLLHKVFKSQEPEQLKKAALEAGIKEDEITAFLVYGCFVFANSGNYKVYIFIKIIIIHFYIFITQILKCI